MTDSKIKVSHPWYTPELDRFIKMMQVAAFVVDRKLIRESIDNHSLGWVVIRFFSRIYRPIAMLRLKHNFTSFLIEYKVMRLALRVVDSFKSFFQQHTPQN